MGKIKDIWSKVTKKMKGVFGKKDNRSAIEKEIDSVAEELSTMDPTSAKYANAAANIGVLAHAKAEMDEANAKLSPKPQTQKLDINTVLTVAGSLAAVGVIVWAESDGGLNEIITTKAQNFVPKFPRK